MVTVHVLRALEVGQEGGHGRDHPHSAQQLVDPSSLDYSPKV